MKTILFQFESPVGTFWIHPEPADRVQLRIDNARLKTYGSAKAAARDVYKHSTGWEAWDRLHDAVAPGSLARWKRGNADAAEHRRRTDRTSAKHERGGDHGHEEQGQG
jgi:hypothetical protein